MVTPTQEQNKGIQAHIAKKKEFKYLEDVVNACGLPKEKMFMDMVDYVLDHYNIYRKNGTDKYKAKIMSLQDGLDFIYEYSLQYVEYLKIQQKLK